MKKVLILGSLGMAGHTIYEYFSQLSRYEIHAVARSAGYNVTKVMDVLSFDDLYRYLSETKPDIVINCVGVLVKESNRNVIKAIMTNSLLPQKLKTWGDGLGYRLIHISTDCVFSGHEGGYSENSFRDGNDCYARTKALGEFESDRHLTIRTSIIGPELKNNGTGLLDWFLKQQGGIKGYGRTFWTGITTLELAKIIDQLIVQNIAGIYHICAPRKISKYELLVLAQTVFERDITVTKDMEISDDKSLVSTRNDFNYPEINYRNMMEELKTWMDERKELYPHYQQAE